MPQDKILLKTIINIIREHPEYFEALVEFERTKRLPKLSYKTRANFTIDSEIIRKFREYCRKNGYKMSTKLENFMMEELKKAK